MSETSFASLNPSLLARKGGAKPAMRPHMGVVPGMGVPGAAMGNAAEDLDDLGWNDMGHDDDAPNPDTVHLTPAPANQDTAVEAAANDAEAEAELIDPAAKPPVRKQQEAISEQFARPAAKAASAPRTAGRKQAATATRGKRAAFTLRLDAERHLKLRLASTIRNCSSQTLVTEALDTLLAGIEELDSLAAQVKRS